MAAPLPPLPASFSMRSPRKAVLLGTLLCLASAQAQGPVAGHVHTNASASTGTVPGCLADELRHRQPPQRALRLERINDLVRRRMERRGEGQRDDLTIPVVVHIVHYDGPENISDEQVQQGIADLNDAFANTGAYQQADGVDIGIRFCLAQQDIDHEPTTGITRTLATLTEMVSETQDLQLKSLVRWDPEQYLNIWLVREITSQSMGAGVAGYAYFPSSHGGDEDGIVNEARWFGSSTDNSKVHIHEVGHYLGLYHTFEGGCTNSDCLSDGDRVCDTPPDNSVAAVPCPGSVNTCTSDADDTSANNPFRPVAMGGLGDRPDLFQDYMDYGLQACQHRFTEGQAERMRAMLEDFRSSLLDSEGCDSPCPGLVIVGFTVPMDINPGEPYTFLNSSNYMVTVGWSWIVDGVEVATTEDLPWTFTTTGTHTVTLRMTNIANNCYEERTAAVLVVCDVEAGFTMAPSNPSPGGTVTLTNTSAATSVHWLIDGVNVGSGATFTTGPLAAGGYPVQQIASSTACSDTSDFLFLPVGGCASGANNTLVTSMGNLLDFNSGGDPVVTVTGSFLGGGEGMSSICDANGRLLLYTDGQSVYNGNDVLIGSGLLGGGSSTQAALIVQKPGSNTVFYIFTTDDWLGTGTSEMLWSEVDLSLNGGVGDMVVTNQFLMSPTSEKLCAVRGCNGEDIWVIGLVRNTPTFHAYRVTSAGIDLNPVISAPGFQHGPELGELKGSPKGDKLAGAFREGQPNSVMLFDFNNQFGIVTNPVSLGALPLYQQYGVEFSPDGSKLYVSNADDFLGTRNHLYQYDLTTGVPEIMIGSRTLVGSSNCTWAMGSLQRAPNGRIYALLGSSDALGEIRHPDLAGTACMFIDNAVPVLRSTYGFGLGNRVPTRSELAIPMLTGPRQVCPNSGPTPYRLSCTGQQVTLQHHGPSDYLGAAGNVHTLDIGPAGTDTLIISWTNDCGTNGQDTVLIHVGGPVVQLGNDTSICSTADLLLDAGVDGTSWLWTNPSGGILGVERRLTVSAPGTYIATVVGTGGCSARDTIVVTQFASDLQIDLGPDIYACTNVVEYFHGPVIPGATYLWSNGSQADSVRVNMLWNEVWLTVTTPNGCSDTDTMLVNQVVPPSVDLGPDGTLCPGATRTLGVAPCDDCTYLWNDGSTSPTLTAYGPGTYHLTVTNRCGENRFDEITLTAGTGPVVDLGPDRYLCPFEPFTLNAGVANATYIWNDGTTGQTHAVNGPGVYGLTVITAQGCASSDSLTVSVCTGVGGLAEAAFSVLPNPANDRITVRSGHVPGGGIEVLDAVGRIVLLGIWRTDGRGARADMDVSSLAAGTYTLRSEAGSVQVVIAH